MNQEQIKLTQSRDFGETLNAVFIFAAKHIKPLSLLFFTYALIPVLLTGVLAAFINQDSIKNVFMMLAKQQVVQTPPNIGALFLYGISALISYTFIAGLVYEYLVIYNENDGEVASLPEVWNRFWKDLPALLGYQLLLGLSIGVIGMFAIIFIMLFATLSVVIVAFLVFFLIIFYIYILIPLSFLLMIKVKEDQGFTETWNRCFKLVKDHWWVTFGLILVISIIQTIMAMTFSLPQTIYYITQGISTYTSGQVAETNQSLSIVFNVITNTGSSWLYILLNLTIGFHYFSLAEKKDNNSLLNRIENISTTETEL